MNVLVDSFSVLVDHWPFIVGIVLTMLLSQMLIGAGLKWIFREQLTAEEYFSLKASGWILPLFLASVLWLAWRTFQTPGSGGFVIIACMAILAIVFFRRTRNEPAPGSKATLLLLLVLFGVFIFLRLAFVSKVIVPLYFDSAQHYLIIKNLLQDFHWITSAYYHMGFHLLTAFTASSLRVDIIDAMLILGQMIVVSIPFSTFSIIKQETQSNSAGLFAVLLAVVGWYMPAYAVNWGKYPALTSLPLLTFVTSLAYLLFRYKNVLSIRSYRWLNAILLSGIIITGLVHSRSLIVLGILALSWSIVTGWQKLPRLLRVTSFLAVILSLILLVLFIRTKDIFGLLFDPYWEKGLFITLIVLFLAIFAQWAYPRPAFASILAILFLLGSLLIPVRVPGYGNLTLLDRPFVEMILYLPLSFLGGAGLAGLEKTLQRLTAKWTSNRLWRAEYLSGVLVGVLLINAFANYNLYPAGCCEIVGRDDLVAIDWMDKNLPPKARIAISSTELRVIDTDSSQGAAGGDAGIWITPLTGRATTPLPYQSDFSQQTVFDALCQRNAGYLYVGETGTTFNNAQIAPYSERYKLLLSMPKAQVYQVIGCK